MKKRLELISTKEVFKRSLFRVEEARFRFERYDGTMSDEVVRLDLDRGDSVAALVHDTDNDTVVLTEQFRYPTFQKGPGWVMEIPAGVLGAGEDPAQAIRREILEEVGYAASHLEPVCRFYASPGGTSERILLFYARVTASDRVSVGGGLDSEAEDIKTVRVAFRDALRAVHDGDIVDAKTIIALQWLALAGDRAER